MDKNNVISVFNTQFTSFITDLISVYPDDKDLYKFKTSIRMLLLYDEEKVIVLFNDFIFSKYKDKIEKRDSDFFLKNNYEDLVEQNQYESPEITIQLINKIKSYWTDMSDANKGIVWNYFNIFSKLCEKY